MKSVLLTVITLGLTWLASSWALLRPGFFRVHDFVHAARIAEVTRAASEGHFPIRWSPNFGTGYGMPLFEFYAPLPYYVGAVLWWSGLPIVTVLKVLWALCSLLTMLGAYFLGRSWFKNPAGLVVAAAVTLAPYRAVNLYVRGALSEAWGMMAMPWILLGLWLQVRGHKWGWLITVLGIVTLGLSHNLTTLLFVPLSGLFWLGLLLIDRPSHWRKTIWQTIGSYLLGLGLIAFYFGPTLLEKDYTKVAGITGGYFDFKLHFLYIRQFFQDRWGYGGSSWGPEDGISFFLGWGQLVGFVLSVVIVGRSIEMSRDLWHKRAWTVPALRDRFKTIWLRASSPALTYTLVVLCLGLSLAMTLQRSQIIWDAVPLLQFVQFPWRWLGPVAVFLGLAVGMAVNRIQVDWQRTVYAGLLIASIVGLNWRYFQPETILIDTSGMYATDPASIQTRASEVLNDYVPRQMPGILELKPPTTIALVGSQPVSASQILVNHGHEKLIAVQLDQPTQVVWSIADFPGWEVWIDGHLAPKQVAGIGLVAVDVPAGEHQVGARWGATPVRQVSDLITGLSSLVLLALIMQSGYQWKKPVKAIV